MTFSRDDVTLTRFANTVRFFYLYCVHAVCAFPTGIGNALRWFSTFSGLNLNPCLSDTLILLIVAETYRRRLFNGSFSSCQEIVRSIVNSDDFMRNATVSRYSQLHQSLTFYYCGFVRPASDAPAYVHWEYWVLRGQHQEWLVKLLIQKIVLNTGMCWMIAATPLRSLQSHNATSRPPRWQFFHPRLKPFMIYRPHPNLLL